MNKLFTIYLIIMTFLILLLFVISGMRIVEDYYPNTSAGKSIEIYFDTIDSRIDDFLKKE